ncbi:MAG: alpha/beta hydrolase [Pseudomonadota bacterium]
MSDGAPLLSTDSSRPPPGGAAVLLTTDDDVRLRAAYWPGEGRGTVVLFQGRTEFIEKYYETVGRFLGLGFAVGTLDWRGQGLSARLLDDRRKGYVPNFSAYQRDADALIEYLESIHAPKPWVLVGHSMGGAISARLLMRRGELFAASILSAPMLGLFGSRVFNGLASVLSRLRRSSSYATGCDRRTAADIGFTGNFLTTDMRRFETYASMVKRHDQLALGGPSWGWLRAAYREMRAIRPTKTPMLIAIGEEDRVVSADSCRAYLGDAENRVFLPLSDARHEPFLEVDSIQAPLWDGIGDFLAAHAPDHQASESKASA